MPGVLSPSEVAAANASVDAHAAEAVQASHRKGMARIPDGTSLDDTSRWDYRGMLGWEPAESRAPFVNMLGHPKLTRYLNTICGKGFRVRRRLGPSLRVPAAVSLTSTPTRSISACASCRLANQHKRHHQMDHGPTLITQHQGSPAGNLHGQSGPGFSPASYYLWKDGSMHNGLVVVSFQLCDCPEGAGGLVRPSVACCAARAQPR